jgi:hypothetical protein
MKLKPILFLLAALLAFPAAVHAAASAFVQIIHTRDQNSNNSIPSANFPGAVTTGNTIVCSIFYNAPAETVTGVADDGTNTYTFTSNPSVHALLRRSSLAFQRKIVPLPAEMFARAAKEAEKVTA